MKYYLKIALAGVLSLLLASVSPAFSDPLIVDVPIDKTAGDHPIPFIRVDVDGVPANLALDTGSLGLAITSDFLTRSEISLSDRSLKVTYPDGSKKDLRVSEKLDVSVTGDTIWANAFAVIDHTPLSDELSLDGNIDPVWLSRDGCAEIDFKSMRIRFAHLDSLSKCPFSYSGKIEVARDDKLQSKNKNDLLVGLLDTGAALTSIDSDLVGDAPTLGQGRVSRVWGNEMVKLVGPKSFSVGGFVFDADMVAVHQYPFVEGTHLKIGIDLLWDANFIVHEGHYFWSFSQPAEQH